MALVWTTLAAFVEMACRQDFLWRVMVDMEKACTSPPQVARLFSMPEPYGCIILCRVVLGKIEVLERDCERRFSPSHGFDSTHAKKGYTEKSPGEVQLHDEYIVYDPAAVYPELVLHVSSL